MNDCLHLQPQNIGIRVTVDDRPDGDLAEYQAFYLNRQSLCRDSGGTPDTRDGNPSQAEQVLPLWRNARSNLTWIPNKQQINYCEARALGISSTTAIGTTKEEASGDCAVANSNLSRRSCNYCSRNHLTPGKHQIEPG